MAEHHALGSGLKRIGYPIGVRRLTVVRRDQVTPGILRVTLGGAEMAGFHSYQADDHVRLVFPDADGVRRDPVPNADLELDWPEPHTPSRKYTLRRVDLEALELDLDVVVHDAGVGSDWARTVAIGDEVTVAGPPGAITFPQHHPHFVFAVDTTALPAAARWLEESPPDVSAHLLIDVDDDADTAYPLAQRAGVEVRWLNRGGGSQLAAAVQELTLPEGTFVFAAGESEDIKPLRRWAKGRHEHLITGYWRRGVADLDD